MAASVCSIVCSNLLRQSRKLFVISNRHCRFHSALGHHSAFSSLVSENFVEPHPTIPSISKAEAPVVLSKECIKRMKVILGQGEYLRVAVDGGGCSGFQYTFQLDTRIEPGDRVIEQDGVRVVIDSASLQYLVGSTIDYSEELIRSSFRVINNPKAEHGCSCGASFAIKP